ncbi:hypothetical protein [Candidatus Poriferisodalis sp.]|uniref:hypothetical protein n=1 Tax=Candidatus Poriferisodalis sp. TaxID=3101277 RepID=UPI003B02B1D2
MERSEDRCSRSGDGAGDDEFGDLVGVVAEDAFEHLHVVLGGSVVPRKKASISRALTLQLAVKENFNQPMDELSISR